MQKMCKVGHLEDVGNFNFVGRSRINRPGTKRYLVEGPRQLRARCKLHEVRKRKDHLTKFKRGVKNNATTHGGKAMSRQSVRSRS